VWYNALIDGSKLLVVRVPLSATPVQMMVARVGRILHAGFPAAAVPAAAAP